MDSYTEVEELLNATDARRFQRREHHLPRAEYRDVDAVYFVTLCARHHQDPFRNKELATAVVEAIQHRCERGVWKAYAYCLMPDHLHPILQLVSAEGKPLKKDLLEILGEFRSFTTRRAWKLGFHGRLWQHDQYDRQLRNAREFDIRCQYLLDNPVRKGYVDDWAQWPYSGVTDDW